MKKCILSIIILACASMIAYAQPTQPILRIENGMHSATGSRISADADGKYLLTCSDDKTARLWDAASGRLLNTLRIPIGLGNDGKIYACALSPNGRIAAAGGWTGYGWDKTHSIYIINVQTGEIIYRIQDLPDVIFDIQFSPDGQWMGVGLGSNGARIFNTKNWNIAKTLDEYKGDVYGVTFDKSDRFVTVSHDGNIRLYDDNFDLITSKTGLSGTEPFQVSFDKTGERLAVAYGDVPVVEVRSGKDLSLLYKPSVEGIDNGFYGAAFSTDGKLFAGGGYQQKTDDGNYLFDVRIWDNYGRGNYKDILLTENSILNIKPLPNGKMAVIGFHPDLAVLQPDGSKLWYKAAGNNAYNANDKYHFRINNTGSVVGITPFQKDPLTFDVASRKLTSEQSIYPSFTDKNSIAVTEWRNTDQPYINDNKVTFLQQYEQSRSVDINKAGTEVIIGASWNLYKADAKANKIWSVPMPGEAWAVNISGNDKTVAVALGDGTIRWYRMSDGMELLAFYLHTDRKRWVLFTPSGYYDASPGAEDMLGWHVNNGKDAAPSFYPASRFRNQFYRSDIIDLIFDTYDEEKAIAQANLKNKRSAVVENTDIRKKLPPVVTILSPANGSTINNSIVSISYSVNSPADAPVKNIKVLVNGRPVSKERGLLEEESNDKIVKVSVPEGNNTITLLAENENGLSPEANLFVKYEQPKTTEEFVTKPTLYGLVIGVAEYKNPDLKLGFSGKDAGDFSNEITKQKGTLYKDVVIKKFINADATKENILDGLDWIQRQTTQKDIAMIFFAGHGVNDNNGIYYMLPYGAEVDRLRTTCINFEELRQTVSGISGKVMVFIDACHSGNVMGVTRRGGDDIGALVNELSSTENGAITFTSSTGREYSLEDPSWNNGAFTKALIEGLDGKAAIPGKNKITVKSLDSYISERVKELTKGKQHPTSVVPPNIPDFPIGVSQ